MTDRLPPDIHSLDVTELIDREGWFCAPCGHRHAGRSLAYICVGCPCPRQPPPEGSDAHAIDDKSTARAPADMTPAPSSPAGGAALPDLSRERLIERLTKGRMSGRGLVHFAYAEIDALLKLLRLQDDLILIDPQVRQQAATIRQQAEEIIGLKATILRQDQRLNAIEDMAGGYDPQAEEIARLKAALDNLTNGVVAALDAQAQRWQKQKGPTNG